eukprot:128159-Prorocentrum_minimum.AAC.4
MLPDAIRPLPPQAQMQPGAPVWVNVSGSITYIRHENGVMYPACPNKNGERNCSKKLREEDMGHERGWYCDKCAAPVPTCDWRYMMSITAADHTGNSWLTVFSEAVRKTPSPQPPTLMPCSKEPPPAAVGPAPRVCDVIITLRAGDGHLQGGEIPVCAVQDRQGSRRVCDVIITPLMRLGCLGVQGEQIFGMSAPELHELQESDPPAYDRALSEANFKPFVFRLRVAEESYNDEVRGHQPPALNSTKQH